MHTGNPTPATTPNFRPSSNTVGMRRRATEKGHTIAVESCASAIGPWLDTHDFDGGVRHRSRTF